MMSPPRGQHTSEASTRKEIRHLMTRRSDGQVSDGEEEEDGELPIPGFPVEPVLEPELIESPVFRNRDRHTTAGHKGKGHSGPLPNESEEANVETPLLNGVARSASGSSSTLTSDENDNDNSSTTEADHDPDNPYLGGVSVAQFRLLMTIVAMVFFIGAFDGTMLASSHPVITSYFGASNSASWLSTSYLLTATTFQLIVTRFTDSVGRKWPFVAMLAIFAGATVWCALAQSMNSLIAARAVCGLGAGCAMTCGGVLLGDLVPIQIRGLFQSYIGIAFGIGGMLGAALGGAMADHLGWRWEFGVQVPFILICIIIAVIYIPPGAGIYDDEKESLLEAFQAFDFRGSVLMTVSITFLILGLNLGGNILPWGHPFVITSLVIFVTVFPVFLFAESRAGRPIMPLDILHGSPHANILFSHTIGAVLINAILFNIPLYFQGVLLTSATTSGLYLLVPTVVSSICGVAVGFIVTRTRWLKWPLVVGAAGYLTGTVLLTSLDRSYPAFVFLLALMPGSAAQGLSSPGTFIALLSLWEQRRQAVVTSTLILWRSLGTVLGVACSSLVVQNALLYYLRRYVDLGSAEEDACVIELVRAKVEAVKGLEGLAREQVVQSYEAALRMTFLCCTVLAVINVGLLVPVKLKRLEKTKPAGGNGEDAEA